MKRILLLFLSFLFLCTLTYAQNFQENFENYNVGDYLCLISPDWTTWSGNTGGAEDVKITSDNSLSGFNSIRLSSTAQNGGPQDIVLPFGQVYTTGRFAISINLYVQAGSNAYLNLQGQTTVGQLWSLNVWFRENGVIQVADNQPALFLESNFTHNEWFEFEMDLNLKDNQWKILVDGQCVGSFSNPNNRVASLNLYPILNSNFYVDDINYSYDSEVESIERDAGISQFSVDNIGLTGGTFPLSGTIQNNGTETITSFEIKYTSGDNVETTEFDGLNIDQGGEWTFFLPYSHTIAEGDNSILMELTKVNGVDSDDEVCNNVWSSNVTGITPATDKRVLVEEATGTWCIWCPRGAVFMDLLADKYPDHFVPVAVHAGSGGAIDPMEVTAHANGIRSHPDFQGFPSVLVMRDEITDPSTMEIPSLNNLTSSPRASLRSGAEWNESARELSLSLTAKFKQSTSGNYRLAFILTEDFVTGTGALYAQANAYAGGAFGPMGGYENLPDPVPASQMIYDHVSRAIIPSFNGEPIIGGGQVVGLDGERSIHATVNLSSAFNINNMHIVGILIDPSGRINNVITNTVEEAEANGLVSNVEDIKVLESSIVSPNPFSDYTQIRLSLDEAAHVKISAFNSMGELITSRDYGKQVGDQVFIFRRDGLPSGVYFLNIQVDDEMRTKKVIVAPK